MELDVAIRSYGMYANKRGLRVPAYVDDEWPHVRWETLCTSKITYSLQSVPVVLDYVGAVHDDWKVVKTAANLVELYASHVTAVLDNPTPRLPKDHIRASGKSSRELDRTDRPRYYYFVIDDCSLEQRYNNDKIPDMTFTATVKSGAGGIITIMRMLYTASIYRPVRMGYVRCYNLQYYSRLP